VLQQREERRTGLYEEPFRAALLQAVTSFFGHGLAGTTARYSLLAAPSLNSSTRYSHRTRTHVGAGLCDRLVFVTYNHRTNTGIVRVPARYSLRLMICHSRTRARTRTRHCRLCFVVSLTLDVLVGSDLTALWGALTLTSRANGDSCRYEVRAHCNVCCVLCVVCVVCSCVRVRVFVCRVVLWCVRVTCAVHAFNGGLAWSCRWSARPHSFPRWGPPRGSSLTILQLSWVCGRPPTKPLPPNQMQTKPNHEPTQ
jgi:hypothetical protein